MEHKGHFNCKEAQELLIDVMKILEITVFYTVLACAGLEEEERG